MERKNLVTLVGALVIVMATAGMAAGQTVSFIIENSTGTVFQVDENGLITAYGNLNMQSGTISGTDLNIEWGNMTGTFNLSTTVFSGTLGMTNITVCTGTQIMKMDTGVWTCATDDTGTGGNTTEEVQDAAWDVLGGTQTGITVTYEDGTDDVDFVVTVTDTDTNVTSACAGAQLWLANGSCVSDTDYLDDTTIADTDTNATTECSGSTTYLDGEGNCDDIAPTYGDVAGDIYTGVLNVSATNLTLSNSANITDADSAAFIYFNGAGGVVVHIEA